LPPAPTVGAESVTPYKPLPAFDLRGLWGFAATVAALYTIRTTNEWDRLRFSGHGIWDHRFEIGRENDNKKGFEELLKTSDIHWLRGPDLNQ
jgi:hypothetical protein